jgi:hypothetical protein
MQCPRVSNCPLFKQFAMKSSLRVWQSLYCESSPARCERYKLACAEKPVPTSLLPNGRTLDVPLEELGPKHFT